MVDRNTSSGSPKETQNPNPDGNAPSESDLALDNLAQKDIWDTSFPEGPIEEEEGEGSEEGENRGHLGIGGRR
ncbi:Glycylpeptide N-tetradecanoyltransferase 1 [Sesbania bispinosa]|nr:Glycylpeptide N-tetradecanoyltransferase 1 [Sesbania bispinosa]